MKTMFKLSFVLAAYTVIACVGLAVVYNITAPLIAEAAAKEVKTALAEIFPEAKDFEEVTGKLESGNDKIVFNKVFVATSDSGAIGMVVQVTGPTYASATLLIGVGADRKLKPVKFMALTDTPGLGLKAAQDPFRGQFTGKSVDDAFTVGSAKSGADVVAISGSTITSKGVSKIIKLTGALAGDYLGSNYGAAAQK